MSGGAWRVSAGVARLGGREVPAVLPIGGIKHRGRRAGVRAWDRAGNLSAMQTGAIFGLAGYEGTTSLVKYSGTWKTQTTSKASGGSTRYTASKGASVTITFTGSGFAWIAPMGPTSGSVRPYVDGDVRLDISLYRSSYLNKVIVYSVRWPTVGLHAIKLVSSGTAGHPRIDLDAYVVTR